MVNYGVIQSSFEPNAIEYTEHSILEASNIEEYTIQDKEGHTIHGYSYNLIEYTKEEYLEKALNKIASLEEELAATKIILGVE